MPDPNELKLSERLQDRADRVAHQRVRRPSAARPVRRRQQQAPGREVRLHALPRRPGQRHQLHAGLAHAQRLRPARTQWIKEHGWESHPHLGLPDAAEALRRIVAASSAITRSPTSIRRRQPRRSAEAAAAATTSSARIGCFGCHEITGRKGGRRIGPDLRLEPNPPLDELTAGRASQARGRPGQPARQPAQGRPEPVPPHREDQRGLDREVAHVAARLPARHQDAALLRPDATTIRRTRCRDRTRRSSRTPRSTAITHYLFEASNELPARTSPSSTRTTPTRRQQGRRSRCAELLAKGKLERRGEERARRRRSAGIRLRKVDAAASTCAARLQGRRRPRAGKLFIERGCLACHSHQATDEPGQAASRTSPAITSEADFGPNLSQVADQARHKPGDKESARTLADAVDPQPARPQPAQPHAGHAPDAGARPPTSPPGCWPRRPQDLGADWNELDGRRARAAKTLKNLAHVYLVAHAVQERHERAPRGRASCRRRRRPRTCPQDEQELAEDDVSDDNA